MNLEYNTELLFSMIGKKEVEIFLLNHKLAQMENEKKAQATPKADTPDGNVVPLKGPE